MGIDEANKRFFHHDAMVVSPNAGQTLTAMRLPIGDVIICHGPIVVLSAAQAVDINAHSRAGGSFTTGIIDRTLKNPTL